MKKKSILEFFLKNEIKVKKLYELYAEKFSEQGKLWERLIKEEGGHIELLRELIEKIGQSNKFFDLNEYSLQIAERTCDFIDAELVKTKSGNVTLITALEAALRLERSMIEKKCFEMFRPGHKEIERVFNTLNKDTDGHATALERAYRKEMNKLANGNS